MPGPLQSGISAFQRSGWPPRKTCSAVYFTLASLQDSGDVSTVNPDTAQLPQPTPRHADEFVYTAPARRWSVWNVLVNLDIRRCERLRAMSELAVAVIASHNGSNLQALHRASITTDSQYRIALVLSNNSGSGTLKYARQHQIPALHLSGHTHPDPDKLDEVMRLALLEHAIGLVVTAGYLKRIGPRTRREFSNHIINIHPSLLPRHGGIYGQAVHRAVLASGDRVSGPSVHVVTEEYDAGEVIARKEVPVLPVDSVEALAARVLEAEHVLLPAVVRDFASGRHPVSATAI